jgi:hypothetical protein
MQKNEDSGTPGAALRGRPPSRGRRRQATVAALAALVCLTVLAAGCSSGQQAAGGLRPPSTSQSDQEMVGFARCMRAHGVQISDPFHRPGHSGLTIDMPTQDAATRPGYAACNHFIARLEQVKAAGAASQAAPNLPALTRYAECMRAHDINMLDPTPQGELALGNVPGMAANDFGRYSPQFRTADTDCRHLLPAGVADDGTGP